MAGEVGQARGIRITGCNDDVVGPIMRGDYLWAQISHGKPAYRKDAVGDNHTVMIYFWDERDGDESAGWWIGPEIGGDMVWAHHPNRASATPPTGGWQAPHSAPADPTMELTPIVVVGGVATRVVSIPQPLVSQAQMQQLQQQQAQMQQLQQQQQAAAMQARQQQMAAMQAQQQQAQLVQQQQQLAAARAQQQQMQQFALQRVAQQEQMIKCQREQVAALNIRKALWNLRTVLPDTFDSAKAKLMSLVAAEFPKCGSQTEAVQADIDKAVAAAIAKIDHINEMKARNEEKIKELAAKHEVARENARGLLSQAAGLLNTAESASNEVGDQIRDLAERTDTPTIAAMDRAIGHLRPGVEDAIGNANAAAEFIKKNMDIIRTAPFLRDEKRTAFNRVKEILERSDDANALANQNVLSLNVLSTKFSARAAALEVVNKQKAIFIKYDSNRDSILDETEIMALAKAEYKITLTPENISTIFASVVVEGEKGVKFDAFMKLLSAVGIAREKAIDDGRRAKREAREKELADKKQRVKASIDDIASTNNKIAQHIVGLSSLARDLTAESTGMKAAAMFDKISAMGETVKEVESAIEASQEKAEVVGKEEVDEDLQCWIQGQKNMLSNTTDSFEAPLAMAKNSIAKFNTTAMSQDAAEVKELGKKVLARIRAYLSSEKMSPAELFKNVAGSGGTLDKQKFVSLMLLISKVDKNGDELAEDDFGRAFAAVDEDKSGGVLQEVFVPLCWTLMKVVKDTALTDTKDVDGTRVVRRLEVGEAVEVLAGPVVLDELKRINVRALQDGKDGWVSIYGTQGAVFLTEGASTFEVLKETLLTESYDTDAPEDDAVQKRRTLSVGEKLLARSCGRKQEETGLTRMKVKAKSDGRVGWVTTVGSTGIRFVQII